MDRNLITQQLTETFDYLSKLERTDDVVKEMKRVRNMTAMAEGSNILIF